MTDISELQNPYDFANAVKDDSLFAGREEELNEIQYYLDHAKASTRPINIALLGPRASGKTSLLNMCEIEAQKRDFCTVRINLDEGDILRLPLFFKIFDAILSAVCELGEFGGKQGKTYQTYLDMVYSYNIPEDNTYCPFLFPLNYSIAMRANNKSGIISDNSFLSDLKTVQEAIGKPCILLFDEADILAHDRINLQKLRNIFMNSTGYMLVFAGTPSLFPAMNEVFSPIIRQFKRITIRGFSKRSETKECVLKPLHLLEIDPESIFQGDEMHNEIREIHRVTGGRPHEIHLICHFMFRRLQRKRAKYMALTLPVLEEVRKELETSEDITTRPILSKIRQISVKNLKALATIGRFHEQASLDEIWKFDHVVRGDSAWSREELEGCCNDLIDQEILGLGDGGKLTFMGDDFDRTYATYYAHEKHVAMVFPDWKLNLTIFLEVILQIEPREKDGTESEIPSGIVATSSFIDNTLADTIMRFNNLRENSEKIDYTPADIEIIDLMAANYQYTQIDLRSITLDIFDTQTTFWVYALVDEDQVSNEYFKRTSEMQERAIEVGVPIRIDEAKLPIIPPDKLYALLNLESEGLKQHFIENHWELARRAYFDHENDKAIHHVEIITQLDPPHHLVEIRSDLSYILFSAKRYDEARNILATSIDELESKDKISNDSDTDQPLWYYNLAIAEAASGNLIRSTELVKKSLEILENVDEEGRIFVCLFVAHIYDNSIFFSEEADKPNLWEIAKMTLDTIEKLLDLSVT